jgi:hypothetical protein
MGRQTRYVIDSITRPGRAVRLWHNAPLKYGGPTGRRFGPAAPLDQAKQEDR